MALEGYDEYPGLKDGVAGLRREEFSRLGDAVYLDHAGATLYTATQVKRQSDALLSHVYGNPHSGNPSSEASAMVVASARERVLRHFGVTPETHTVIFTSGATASLKLVVESFAFGNDSILAYHRECHTSGVGLRGVAQSRGVPALWFDENDVTCETGADNDGHDGHASNASSQSGTAAGPSLVVFPGQSNFCGRKFPLTWVQGMQSGAHRVALHVPPVAGGHAAATDEIRAETTTSAAATSNRRWHVLLDAAALVSTSPLDLSTVPADFVALSFYKMFGLPTGLGALIVRNESAPLLRAKAYFGGGSLDAYSPTTTFVQPREALSGRFEDGTVSFLAIAALDSGFDVLTQLGMLAIQRHTFALAKYTAHGLEALRHHDGSPVVQLYSATKFDSEDIQGPVVTFNLKRSDGTWVGFAEVERLASLRGVHLRTGCFCNAGACQRYLNIDAAQLDRIVKLGYTCGSTTDVVDGRPVGCIRVSFGYMSTVGDADALLAFLAGSFVETAPAPAALVALASGGTVPRPMVGAAGTGAGVATTTGVENEQGGAEGGETVAPTTTSAVPAVRLSKIHVFPIKSCGAFEVDAWEIDDQGLRYDRTWMIVSVHGSCISQKQNSKLALVKPTIDLQSNWLILRATGMDPIAIPLDRPTDDDNGEHAMAHVASNGTATTTIATTATTTTSSAAAAAATDVAAAAPSTSSGTGTGTGAPTKSRPARLVRVCNDKVLGDDCGDAVAAWLAAVVGVTCRLVRQNPEMHRACRLTRAASRAGQRGGEPDPTQLLSLANESQFLLVSEASMREVNRRAERPPDGSDPVSVSVDRFRGNLIVEGGDPFDEDRWASVRIGTQSFEVTAPCQRCQMVCVDQQTGERTKEPLLALSKFRRHQGATYFGQHLRHMAAESGQQPFVVRVGDAVIPLESQE
eukprot:m.65858 g.65858  ORF g.65858 m.65858 type:complete len:918 (+) comp8319_c0_seq3:88-2841(+)